MGDTAGEQNEVEQIAETFVERYGRKAAQQARRRMLVVQTDESKEKWRSVLRKLDEIDAIPPEFFGKHGVDVF